MVEWKKIDNKLLSNITDKELEAIVNGQLEFGCTPALPEERKKDQTIFAIKRQLDEKRTNLQGYVYTDDVFMMYFDFSFDEDGKFTTIHRTFIKWDYNDESIDIKDGMRIMARQTAKLLREFGIPSQMNALDVSILPYPMNQWTGDIMEEVYAEEGVRYTYERLPEKYGYPWMHIEFHLIEKSDMNDNRNS